MSRARIALALLGLLAAACERIPAPQPEAQALQVAPAAGLPLFARADPRLTVAHRAVRKIEFPQMIGPGGSFHERLTTDGHGHFSIQPIDMREFPSFEWDRFELVQHAREGFLFRYRDFVVRDPEQFERTWTTTNLGPAPNVAGRTCQLYRVERTVGEPREYELSIDEQTGLVLASREFDAAGRIFAAMTYESIELAPDLGPVAWHERSNAEQALDLRSTFEQPPAQRPLRPRLIPAGYRELAAATVQDGDGKTWLELTYSDGVEPLFFLQALAHATKPTVARGGPLSANGIPDSPSSVTVFQLGRALAIQGEVDDHELMVIGSAPEAELLDLIESSLP
jgi:hypothetical protein